MDLWDIGTNVLQAPRREDSRLVFKFTELLLGGPRRRVHHHQRHGRRCWDCLESVSAR